MNASQKLPSLDALKAQAKRLRNDLESQGSTLGHSQSLELIAHQLGFTDWNTLHAAIGNRPPPPPYTVGDQVGGRYLGQPFTAEISAVEALSPPGRFRLKLQFDEPVDVVTFDSFSAFRSYVSCVVNLEGVTQEKTSNGQPHLVLDR
jgi:hypothetical protein